MTMTLSPLESMNVTCAISSTRTRASCSRQRCSLGAVAASISPTRTTTPSPASWIVNRLRSVLAIELVSFGHVNIVILGSTEPPQWGLEYTPRGIYRGRCAASSNVVQRRDRPRRGLGCARRRLRDRAHRSGARVRPVLGPDHRRRDRRSTHRSRTMSTSCCTTRSPNRRPTTTRSGCSSRIPTPAESSSTPGTSIPT